MTHSIPQPISGLKEIADAYDLFVVDQWGVLHDGAKPHTGAVDCLRRLKETGSVVALLSNSGKRVSESYKRLEMLGFDRALYDLCITSGEQVFRGLKDRTDPFYADLGPRYVMFAWDEDRGIVEGTGFEEVSSVAEADFILCAGTDRPALSDYEPILKQALERDLPLTCANPDKVSVQPDGSLKICPGAIAAMYEDMGGRVKWHGKPQQNAYDMIRQTADVSGPGLGIGDSLAHDIAGAAGAEMDGLFITRGIHRTDLPDPPTSETVAELGTRHQAVPSHFIESFVW